MLYKKYNSDWAVLYFGIKEIRRVLPAKGKKEYKVKELFL